MPDLKPHESLEDLRATLEISRNHIENTWTFGEWFSFEVRGQDGQWLHTLGDISATEREGLERDYPGMTITPTSMCAAGTVLYSLGYTNIQWADREDVMAVLKVLALNIDGPLQTLIKRTADKGSCMLCNYGKAVGRSHDVCIKEQYVNLVTSWNDTDGRKKREVLDLFDRSIKSVIQQMEET